MHAHLTEAVYWWRKHATQYQLQAVVCISRGRYKILALAVSWRGFLFYVVGRAMSSNVGWIATWMFNGRNIPRWFFFPFLGEQGKSPNIEESLGMALWCVDKSQVTANRGGLQITLLMLHTPAEKNDRWTILRITLLATTRLWQSTINDSERIEHEYSQRLATEIQHSNNTRHYSWGAI